MIKQQPSQVPNGCWQLVRNYKYSLHDRCDASLFEDVDSTEEHTNVITWRPKWICTYERSSRSYCSKYVRTNVRPVRTIFQTRDAHNVSPSSVMTRIGVIFITESTETKLGGSKSTETKLASFTGLGSHKCSVWMAVAKVQKQNWKYRNKTRW